MSKPVDELPVPADVQIEGGSEVLRAFISDGGLSVSLIRGFDEPDTWGLLLVDVIRHVSRAFNAEDGVSEAEVEARIVRMMMAELENPTDLGTTSTQNN
ncbi:DUF5076 domain-containing protein [Methylobrevis albus]|uniref:DUF5076 domain-containing protein n=1 Tax=Methylobrevis albus TaxID=2793297 RepID=A0A931HZL9_9HYPH|nr:DUF5076 domain-containing protein [Methylobrevis albus]MBH0236551.1 DUF5076 domain-containing protein [Methylobrevis albus]